MRAKTLVQPHEWTAFLLRRVAVHIYHLTTANLPKSRMPIITGVTPVIACLTSETQQNRLSHFTRAAESCNVSQPALTRAIQKLEQELGGRLFHRERSYTQLTELGQ